MSLVGKFFLHCGEKYLHTGEIIDQITPEIVLVRFEKGSSDVPDNSSIAIPVSEFVSTMDSNGCPSAEWEFFDSRKELDKYQEWLDRAPTEDESRDMDKTRKVVPLH
jgi:hypothetical protein